jgi:hypothetical protein
MDDSRHYEKPAIERRGMIKLSGMFEHPTADGGTMLTGEMGGDARLVLLRVAERRTPRSPSHILYIAQQDGPAGQRPRGPRSEGDEE